MTDPLPGMEPVPLAPPAEPITGDSHHHLIAPLHRSRRRARLHASRSASSPTTAPAAGATPSAGRSSSPPDPPTGRSARSTHELAHAHGLGYEQYGREPGRGPRRLRHLLRLLGSVGLDVGGESIPYIAGWGEDGALDAIREYAADDRHDRPAHRRRARRRSPSRPTDAESRARRLTPRSRRRFGRGLLRPDDRASPAGGRAARRAAGDCPPAGLTRVGAHAAPDRTHRTTTATPRGDEDELYRRHHRDLHRAVARVVAPRASSSRTPARPRGRSCCAASPTAHAIFAWLRVVAIHEAYRLVGASTDETRSSSGCAQTTATGTRSSPTRDRSTMRSRRSRRSARLAALPERQRSDLALKVAGYSYEEIRAQITGGRTYTNVNKSLVKARARIRLAELRETGAKTRRRPSYE